MPTVESSIATALMARVASLVLSPVHPVAYPNVSFTPPANKKYLRVTHFVNSTDRLFINSSGKHRHKGILQITVCAPLNSGESAGREIAGQVASHFAVDARLSSGGVAVRITKRPNIASALITDTEIQIPVSISYECFA